MPTVPARSPALRVLRNLVLLWAGLSLLGLVGAVCLVAYAMAWGCSAGALLRGSLSWGGCVMASGVGVLGATASLVTAIVVLFFVQLFHLAGVDVRQQPHGRRRWFSRQVLLDETVDAAVDVADLLD